MPYSAAVVGLGNIGFGYDSHDQDNLRIRTHVHAFVSHPDYQLVGAVDTDPLRRALFEEKYHCRADADLAGLYSHSNPEIVAIAVPTTVHAEVFGEIVARKPRAVICEKPLAATVSEAENMLAEARKQGCSVAVNYMRRAEPGTIAIKKMISEGGLGELRKATAWYSKGIANNGSHMIDLFRFLLGDVSDVSVLREGRLWQNSDPEPDLCILFGNTPVYLLAAAEEDYSLNEFELIGSKAMLWYGDGGNHIELREAKIKVGASGIGILEPAGRRLASDMQRYQWHMVEALSKHLSNGLSLPSDGVSALETLRVVERIVRNISLTEKFCVE